MYVSFWVLNVWVSIVYLVIRLGFFFASRPRTRSFLFFQLSPFFEFARGVNKTFFVRSSVILKWFEFRASETDAWDCATPHTPARLLSLPRLRHKRGFQETFVRISNTKTRLCTRQNATLLFQWSKLLMTKFGGDLSWDTISQWKAVIFLIVENEGKFVEIEGTILGFYL